MVSFNPITNWESWNSVRNKINTAFAGLSEVDNTSDSDKPVSTATQTALNEKQNNIQFQDEGTDRGTDWRVGTVNFTWDWVTATESWGTLTVNVPWGWPGGGEANTASNLWSWVWIFAQKDWVDLEFKSLTSTDNSVTITETGNTVDLSAPSWPGGGDLVGWQLVWTLTWTNETTTKTLSLPATWDIVYRAIYKWWSTWTPTFIFNNESFNYTTWFIVLTTWSTNDLNASWVQITWWWAGEYTYADFTFRWNVPQSNAYFSYNQSWIPTNNNTIYFGWRKVITWTQITSIWNRAFTSAVTWTLDVYQLTP